MRRTRTKLQKIVNQLEELQNNIDHTRELIEVISYSHNIKEFSQILQTTAKKLRQDLMINYVNLPEQITETIS